MDDKIDKVNEKIHDLDKNISKPKSASDKKK